MCACSRSEIEAPSKSIYGSFIHHVHMRISHLTAVTFLFVLSDSCFTMFCMTFLRCLALVACNGCVMLWERGLMRKGDLETQAVQSASPSLFLRSMWTLYRERAHVWLHAFSILGQLFSPGLCLRLLATFLHMHGLNFWPRPNSRILASSLLLKGDFNKFLCALALVSPLACEVI